MLWSTDSSSAPTVITHPRTNKSRIRVSPFTAFWSTTTMSTPRPSMLGKKGVLININHHASRLANRISTPNSKIFFLRVLVTSCLIIAAAVVGTINYLTLTKKELRFGEDQYKAISSQALDVMIGSFTRMSKGALVMAKAYSYAYPNSTAWPYVGLAGFNDMAQQLGSLSSLDNLIFAPLVQPAQRGEFVDYMRAYWAADPTMPDLTGTPQSFLGIYSLDAAGMPYPDFDGKVYAYPSTHDNVLWLPFQMTFSADLTPAVLGYNVHTNPLFGVPLDGMQDCVTAAETYEDARNKCGFFSNVVPLPVPTPVNPTPTVTNIQAFILYPIVLEDTATGKGITVGAVTGAVNWATLLSRAVPAYVTGLDCVVTTSDTSFTYSIVGGDAQFKGMGDLHDTHYSEYAQEADLLGESDVSSYATYKLTFYPRRPFFKVYETDAPLVTSVGGVGIILFCSLVFALYDLATSHESTRKEVVLDTKRRFVRFISHEIRTPLNTVRLGLKLLEMELEGLARRVAQSSGPELVAVVQEYLTSWTQLTDDILGNSDSAVDVLNDLLNYDKIEMGTLRLEYSSVPIWSLVKKTSAAFVMQAKQKAIDLQLTGIGWSDQTTPGSDMVDQLRVVGDSTRIAQVLRNLISNALKFTPEHGSVVLNVEWVAEGLPGVHITVPADQAALLDDPRAGAIRVSVTDSGAGLSPDQLSAICSEGVQFNANQLQAGQGSGLGLFISKGLAEQHGGSLTVTSAGLGQGATFTLELPLFRSQDGHVPSAQNSGKATGGSLRGPLASGSNRRVHPGTEVLPQDKLIVEDFDADDPVPKQKVILVVDDADSNRKLLMRILAAKGHLCHGAVNGQEALDKYLELARQGERVDAVLMDFEMPVMDGPTATRHLRAMGCRSLIVGVTGNVLPQDIDHFKEQGANTVLAKPLNIEAFESTLRGYRPPPSTLGEGTLTANASTSQRTGAVSYSFRPALTTALPSSMKLSPAGAEENV